VPVAGDEVAVGVVVGDDVGVVVGDDVGVEGVPVGIDVGAAVGGAIAALCANNAKQTAWLAGNVSA
jgi:hypothetical protein